MPRPDRSTPPLDLIRITFPSDRVTIGDLRALQPQLFAGANASVPPQSSGILIFATMAVERLLAERAFARAAGQPDPHPTEENRRELVLMLNDDYRRYGVSSGLQQTREMVRVFEAAAAEQVATGCSR